MKQLNLEKLCKLLRYDILTSTTEAGSGHPTSSMSAVELTATLFFNGFFKYDPKNPHAISNDRFVLSKGHASPLLYSLYHVAGWISEKELMSLRKFDSIFEGHPTPRIPYVDVATGSLGQGLSVGVGMALGISLRVNGLTSSRVKRPNVFVLLGDSEVAEGQIWEAAEIASYYKLDNLIAILDVNRLGQRGETMEGWDLEIYQKRFEAFGWNTVVVKDGHNLEEVYKAFSATTSNPAQKPTIIIAKTDKGHGISFLQNKDDWHGKPVPKDKLQDALKELGKVDLKIRGNVEKPSNVIAIPSLSREKQSRNGIATSSATNIGTPRNDEKTLPATRYTLRDLIATRETYGEALAALGETDGRIIAFDGEVSNSTYADKFKKACPERFFEMFIAEQNMVSAALGASKIGLVPFASSFAAFLTRAYDQIRVAQYSKPNLKIVGSHAGVSIGQDGPSQMALEDLAMMRAVGDAVVFYPSDAVSTTALTGIMAKNDGLFYMRTTREKTPVLYKNSEKFKIGGSKIVFQSKDDKAVVFAAGITLHESIKAREELKKKGINITVVDLYSVKPIDEKTIRELSQKTKNVIVVEDHYAAGGIGEAVSDVLSRSMLHATRYTHLCVRKLPRSGSPAELMRFEEIDAEAIVKAVKKLL